MRHKFDGELAGEFAKIVVMKNISGQSAYKFNSYEIRVTFMDEILIAEFIRQRYLDKDGNMVEFFGNVNPPFPHKMLLRYKYKDETE